MPKVDRRAITALFLSATALVGLVMSESYVKDAMQPVPGDRMTYGFGSTTKLDGTRVKRGDTITVPMALNLAMRDIRVVEVALQKCITAPLAQYEYEAFLSLGYNVGPSAVCTSSIPLKLALGDYQGACATILDFDGFRDRSKPKVKDPRTGKMDYPFIRLKGLTNRRQKEWRECQGCMTCHVIIPERANK